MVKSYIPTCPECGRSAKLLHPEEGIVGCPKHGIVAGRFVGAQWPALGASAKWMDGRLDV